MITRFFDSILKYSFILCLIVFAQNIQAQEKTDPPVEEVVVDTVAFQNGDTTTTIIEAPAVDSADEEDNKTESVTDTLTLRQVPDSTVSSLKNKKEFEYANDPEYWIKKKEEEQKSDSNNSEGWLNWLFSSPAMRIIMYMLLAAVIIYMIYRIIVNNSLFYSTKKIATVAAAEEEEVSLDNIDEKIKTAIKNKQLRSAVRFMYIKGLQRLDNKGWIRYHSQGTNYEYLNQVSQYKVANDFSFLTRIYEYVWYGEFEISEEQFAMVQSNFEKMYKDIGQ